MNKFKLTIICFILLLSVPLKSYSEELDISFHRQNTMVWCWAATIAMVVEYVTGDSIEDCEVLNKYDRSLGGTGTCCYGDNRCVRTGQTREMAHILGDLFGVHGRYIPRPPSFDEIKRSINNDHPLIATLQNPMGGGHVVVVSGYENPYRVILLDPINGRHVVGYQTLISNFQYGNWTGSFLITPENSNPGGGTPSPTPMPPMSPPTSQCITNWGACFMSVPIPIGAPCVCPSPRGGIPGIAR
jgi:hypothetical protein